jgi:CRISPR-associated protein (TIGR02584 family)
MKKNILLCVAGLTPQIILETLYVLTQVRKEQVDEIRVITTLDGRDKIMTGIVKGRGRQQDSLLDPQHGQFFAFCRDFNIDPKSISFNESSISLLHRRDGLTLPDIRTEEENEIAGDQICEIVRELTEHPDTRLHASAAGGRKTMAIYLTAAMQLFGRADDSLSHVLVSEDFETHPEFFYIPPVARMLKTRDGRDISTADARIYLAPIPFIRLRGLKVEAGRATPYSELVKRAQSDLDYIESEYDLQIDLTSETENVRVESRSVTLTPRELFFYALFAEARMRHEQSEGSLLLDRLTRNDFDRIYRRLMLARGDNVGVEESSSSESFDFLPEMIAQVESKLSKDHDDFRKKVVETNSKINRKLRDAGLPERYMITLRAERGTSCYGLTVSPLRIKILERQ